MILIFFMIEYCITKIVVSFVSLASRARLGDFKGGNFLIFPWENPKIPTLKIPLPSSRRLRGILNQFPSHLFL